MTLSIEHFLDFKLLKYCGISNYDLINKFDPKALNKIKPLWLLNSLLQHNENIHRTGGQELT
jgi:hypothetical protein